jgi:hypothetical protein
VKTLYVSRAKAIAEVMLLPVTPFHYPIAYFLHKIDKRLSLPGLVAGCMFPDLEIPLVILVFGGQVNRLVLHSLLGSALIGTFLAIAVATLVYPPFVSRLFGIEKKKVEHKCKLSFALAVSVFAGVISHVLLDVTNHPYSPVFWPFQAANATPSPLYFALGEPLGYLWMQVIMGVTSLIILINERGKLEALLVG